MRKGRTGRPFLRIFGGSDAPGTAGGAIQPCAYWPIVVVAPIASPVAAALSDT